MLSPQMMGVFLLVFVVGGATAFLATPLNTSDPDVVNILCPSQMAGETRDHEWLTREAIRRNIRRFFLAHPPRPDFFVPAEATLTELYHAFYGSSSSPTRFIKAVNSIAAANVKADSSAQLRYDPAIQGDGESLEQVQATLVARYPQILTSILHDESYSAARSLLGTSYHSIQKFYSHSTWVEQGNVGILEGLGIPGSDLGHLASDEDFVCTSCDSPQGECTANVILGSGLSSGYYEYEDEIGSSFVIPKPTSGGKCSHGGALDTSSFQPAEGGINKDTTSPCFSPHYYLHEFAAEMAVQATDHYLTVILEAVGPEKYRRLFDLYFGSALSICIDTTGSMGDDIDAVVSQVEEIVAHSTVELYVLVPFNDPGVGPLVSTSDPQEFLDAVHALYPHGGGDGPEMFWGGLQMALKATPDYGNIFCFTDADGKDGDLMEGLLSLAQQKHVKVTVILSDIYKKSKENNGGQTKLITSIEEYQRLADSTGGLLISTDKFDVSDIVAIIGEGVETSTVTIENLAEISGNLSVSLPIDNSVLDFEVRITGVLSEATLFDITGTSYDLTDKASLETTPGVEVIAHTSTFMAVRFVAPRHGLWRLVANAVADSYAIVVSATSSLDFLGDFALLDPSPPHPHYRKTEGRPLTNTVYYLEVTLVGHLESEVTNVNKVEFVDKSGTVLREIAYAGAVADQMYIRTDPLPEHSFYIKLSGHVSSGNMFTRMMPVLITPVETSVEVWASLQDLSAKPGDSASAKFIVTNYGLESYFGVYGTDDMGFLAEVNPDRLYLKNNESKPVMATFQVPLDASHGTVSTVIITAQSEKQTQSVNSAIAHFVVLPQDSDFETPICELSNTPNCTGFNFNGICNSKPWTAHATLRDARSGLYRVDAQPEGDSFTVSGFTPGTTAEVTVDYTATCCTTQVDIIGVDGVGNLGKCHIDLGVLGGLIYDFEVDEIGETWMILHWNITPSDFDIDYYDLSINGVPSQHVTCHDLYCRALVTYVTPCSFQAFNLTPVFDYHGSDMAGFPAYTDGVTLDKEPGVPYNGTEITENSITISWHPHPDHVLYATSSRDGDGVVSGIVMVMMSSGVVGLVVVVMVLVIVVTVLVTASI
ncbi:von Willebrand factor A domain-containing protein 7-like [Penaeus japonicus]|uniref:von Willebrand factor A domain-containing protein 7-like n=1 Tax=Penaeus japonicus TaxID=27405 RepID=UPI001C70E0BA|nr:von Willebrand factor A domain-containing protein 7-like [Penaeus japonicus]